ncbi:MAG: EscU/YscU/HrcU family type III secretion system export apparatus switch protein [Actinobacteria bacterium]|nr:EscU/YscU/HrcU family type III secretion system export apparatus switch protein [Actinomycetota bacterium]
MGRKSGENREAKAAAALGYDPARDAAPKVLASGRGRIAERIILEAQKRGVPVYRDAALAQGLAALDLGQEVPPELYPVVAEVLAFLCRVDARLRQKMTGEGEGHAR